MTSHDVISVLRRISGVKQIGHGGTLDPFAQGVLPIAIGKAARLIEYLKNDKEYLAQISFGKSTDTYDCEGRATFEFNSKVALKDIEPALKKFTGEIFQTPPIYSAIKVKGKKLYEYARKGQEVQIEPRKVFIEKLELKSFDEKNQKAEVLIKCSKGTYIRSIAHDLGQTLKAGAHLSGLIRTKSGSFTVDNAVLPETLKTKEDIEKNLINPLSMIKLPCVVLNGSEHEKILTGQFIDNKNNLQNDDFVILIYNNNIKAIAKVNENLIKVKKVFV